MLKSAAWKDVVLTGTANRPFEFLAGMVVSMPEGGYCARHAHRGLEIVYHRRGRGMTTLDDVSLPFEEGSAVIYRPGESHDQLASTTQEDLCIHVGLPARITARLGPALLIPSLNEPDIVSDIRILSSIIAPIDEVERRILDCKVTALLLGLLQAACVMNEEADLPLLRVRQAERFVRERFASIGSVGEVAENVGVSPDYLRHVFKTCRGRSIVQYLNEVRIAHAKLLLTHSGMPLKQIASACGYKDEYYFSAVFRKLTATSPGAHRSRMSRVN